MAQRICRRARPFPWYDSFLRASPFFYAPFPASTRRRAADALRRHHRGERIGVSYVSSLKAMGKIARVDGAFRLGPKYCNL